MKSRSIEAAHSIVPTITDNRGNGSALNKLMWTKYPASAIIMEMASFMKKKGIRASVEWAPREGKREADSRANGNVAGFSPSQRPDVLPSQLQWIVLPQALDYGRQAEEIFQCATESGALQTRNRKGRRRWPEDRLRVKSVSVGSLVLVTVIRRFGLLSLAALPFGPSSPTRSSSWVLRYSKRTALSRGTSMATRFRLLIYLSERTGEVQNCEEWNQVCQLITQAGKF